MFSQKAKEGSILVILTPTANSYLISFKPTKQKNKDLYIWIDGVLGVQE